VARGIDDINTVVLPLDGSILGKDGNAALTLEIVGIHNAIGVAATLVQRAGLFQQFIHQGGLAMIDVGDDGNIAQFFYHSDNLSWAKKRRIVPEKDAT